MKRTKLISNKLKWFLAVCMHHTIAKATSDTACRSFAVGVVLFYMKDVTSLTN